jgi:elongation factor Ts
MISASDVAALRSRTGAGLMDAKRALEEAAGDMDRATELLRIKGLAKATSKQDRVAAEGLIVAYTHSGRIGAMIELNCETDFVARGEDFTTLARELAMQVAASAPLYLSPEDIPTEELERERSLARAEAEASGKPASALEQIVEGRLGKFYEEHCLLKQPYIKDPKRSVETLIGETSGRLGEKLELTRFARFELGRH